MTVPAGGWQRAGGIAVGDKLPTVVLHIDHARVATLVGGTWDVFPGHHDPAYAKGQGQRDIYLNTMVLSGFLDRVVLDWAGPASFICRRSMRISDSVYPGHRLVGEGTVVGVEPAVDGSLDVRVAVVGSTEDGPSISAETTVRIPAPSA
jgi:hypothetical protein